MYKVCLVILFCVSSLQNLCKAYNIYILNKQVKDTTLHLSHFADSSKTLGIKDVIKLNFKKEKGDVVNLAYTDIPHWFSFSYLTPDNQNNFFLLMENSLMDEFEIYFVQNEQIIQNYKLGDIHPFYTRPYNFPDFIIKLPQTDSLITDVYIRLKSEINLLAPFYILNEERLIEKTNHVSTGLGLYYGALLVIFFYSLFLFIRLRDLSYLYYILYLLTYGISLFNFDGLFFKFFTPQSPYLNNLLLYLFIYLAAIFGTLFTIKFLSLKKHWPVGYYGILFFLSPIVVATVGLFIYPNITVHDVIASVFSSLISFVGIISGLMVWIKGYKIAKYYFFAYTFMLSSVIIFVLKDLSFLPSNHFTEYVMHYGSAIEMVLLAFGLADRYNQLRKENEEAQNKIIESLTEIQNIQNKANAELEEKVILRTAELNEQKNLLEIKNKEIIDSINYAKRIQAAIIPSERLIKSYFKNSFIYYQPKDIVAGDFYWLAENNNHLFFAVADCTGHGVPGAMVSVICNNALNRAVKEFNLIQPGEILNKVRNLVIEEFEKSDNDVKDGMDISLCVFEKSENNYFQKVSWAGANNPLWVIRNKQDHQIDPSISEHINIKTFDDIDLMIVNPHIQPIGKIENPEPFYTKTIKLFKNDWIYLFTDGYQDQFGGPKGKKFKSSQLQKLLVEISKELPENQNKIISQTFLDWRKTNEQVDDVCLIGIKI